MPAIAIVGMACEYPDARTPGALWENVLARRRAFRRMPSERLNLADYWAPDPGTLDRTYVDHAAVLEGYAFDRVGFRVSGSTYRSVDLAHWLALDVAARALDDAGFSGGEGLPRALTGVVLGNTLTGEFSRANLMRLRWPYVRRVMDAALGEKGWSVDDRRQLLRDVEARYKEPFPESDTESLAGGLANTIAGRICNYFDLKGGGYTVDGACASSLLAVINACTALTNGDVDVVVAGGVDLSLDPFELVGFAQVGALARDTMRVYDAASNGFWPGEGCGMFVLMRHQEAVAQGRRIHGIIRGWGVSSDGSGGITRPEVEGQILAVRRAYERAGFGADTVALIEGHGTGTTIGDATELRVLSRVRREASATAPPVAVGSVKANIGHTKAAAGMAGLLKATLALQHQILPPTTGCERPHPELLGDRPALRVLQEGEPWPADQPLRAGVSAMGFGGINTHVVLEGTDEERRETTARDRIVLRSYQDAELFVFGAPDRDALARQVSRLQAVAPKLSFAELADVAALLARSVADRTVRAAVVAASPQELSARLDTLEGWLIEGSADRNADGIYLSSAAAAPRVGFLFPGQGAPVDVRGGALRRRFERARAWYDRASLPDAPDTVATEVAQPAIVTASMATVAVLGDLGIHGHCAVGHSLGELSALAWAGVLGDDAVVNVAHARGRAMARLGSPTGAMAAFSASPEVLEALVDGAPVVVAGLNGPQQTTLSGEAEAIDAVVAKARAQGIRAVRLRVSHAFHSPLVEAAAPPLAERLDAETFGTPQRSIYSTVSGRRIVADDDVRSLLVRQVTHPVRFTEAVTRASEEVDLWIEVGPGHVLTELAAAFCGKRVMATEGGGPSLQRLLHAVGAAYAAGAPVDPTALFDDRFTRPIDLDHPFHFLSNPCEQAPVSDVQLGDATHAEAHHTSPTIVTTDAGIGDGPQAEIDGALPTVERVRTLVARRAELPLEAVGDDDRLLTDLHLNSITVGELVIEAAHACGVSVPASPTDFADASVAELAEVLDRRGAEGDAAETPPAQPPGVAAWVRPFTVVDVARPAPAPPAFDDVGRWEVCAPAGHPLERDVRELFATVAGGGVVALLPEAPDETHVDLLLEAVKALVDREGDRRFVLVQQGNGAAAFARSVHVELRDVTTCVVDVPFAHPKAARWIAAEAAAARGYAEARYDDQGNRYEPRLRHLALPYADAFAGKGDGFAADAELSELRASDSLSSTGGMTSLDDDPTHPLRHASPDGAPQAPGAWPLSEDDVVLVSGGGKGITAECALALARATGAALVLLGRSAPDDDAYLAANLYRLDAAGVRYAYHAIDVTDTAAVQHAVRAATARFGPVTAVLHGAARNEPRPLRALDAEAMRATLAPKVRGLQNILAAVDPEQLRLLVTFGSIIARVGMPGEADYALANEWLVRHTEQWGAAHPRCRSLAVEWSVWDDVGMGARLGSLDALARRGVQPIPRDAGVAMLRQLLAHPVEATSVVVTGRFGDPPTLRLEQPDLPLLRFLERPRVHYPGVELVVDADISVDTDPYLDDHVLQGERLLPGVMGLEAMAQAAMALAGSEDIPTFEDVAFLRPIVVPPAGKVTMRAAACVSSPGVVDVVLRCETTSFHIDHFRATCRFDPHAPSLGRVAAVDDVPLALDPEKHLYGHILFHTGRFRRLRSYRGLTATTCVAEIAADDDVRWFGGFVAPTLVLGDPGMRDAAIHAIQACIPHGTLVPTAVERFVMGSVRRSGRYLVHARERRQRGDTFVYDVVVTDGDGNVVERWDGLTLRRLARSERMASWPVPLLGPYVQRRMHDLVPGSTLSVAVVDHDRDDRRTRADATVRQLLGDEAVVRRRDDGKPEVDGSSAGISAAHAGTLTLAVTGAGPVGCDVEPVSTRPPDTWRALLGDEAFALARRVADGTGEPFDVAATRLWSTLESMKKAAVPRSAPVVLEEVYDDGWVLLSSGSLRIATLATEIENPSGQAVLSFLVGSSQNHPAEAPIAS